MVILAAAAGEARAGRGRAILRGIQVATVGVASLWAFEALLYSLGAIAGLTAFRAATASSGRLRIVIRVALQVLAACVVVQLVFALATLIGGGRASALGRATLTTLHEFLTGPVGDLTYDFSPWSPGLAVGALYAASALALVLVLRREPELAAANRPALLVLSGTTGYGIALFSYLVNRSADHIVPYVSLPAVMVVALWLAILLRDDRFSRLSRGCRGGVGGGRCGPARRGRLVQRGAALLAVGPCLRGARRQVAERGHPPPLAPAAARLRRAGRGAPAPRPTCPASTVGRPDLGGSDRRGADADRPVNEIPLSDPWEDSLVPDLHESDVEDAVADARARAADADRPGVPQFLKHGELRPGPSYPTGLAPLETLALRRIAERFRLHLVARAPSGRRGGPAARPLSSAPVLARGHDVPAMQQQAHPGPDRLQAVDHPGLEAHRGGLLEVAASRRDLLDAESELGGLVEQLGSKLKSREFRRKGTVRSSSRE